MKRNLIILLIILICTGVSAFIITPGHDWGDDFAMYLLHAENIASGRPYSATGFHFNELAPMYAPQDYAPGFPLLLVPAVQLFGQDLYLIRIYLLLFFALFLWLTYVLLRDKLPNGYVYAIVGMLGLSTFMIVQNNNILSDIPGAVLFLTVIILLERAFANKGTLVQWFFIGVLTAFAFSVRTTAIVIIPALICFAIFKRQRIWKEIGILAFGFIAFAALLQLLFSTQSNYMDMLLLNYNGKKIGVILHQLEDSTKAYFRSFDDLFIGSMHSIFTNSVAYLGIFIFFIFGWAKSMFTKWGWMDWLVLGYWTLVIIWPGYQGLRYFIPLLPLYFYYAFHAVQALPQKAATAIAILLVVMAFISIGSGIDNNRFSTKQYGITSKEALALFEHIKTDLQEDDLIMAAKPRAVCYMTRREGIVFPDPQHFERLSDQIATFGVDYILVNTFKQYPPYAQELKQDTAHYKHVYTNAHWILLQPQKP